MPILNQTTKKEAIEQIASIWKLLSEEEQNLLFDQLTLRTYRKNEAIYVEGETPTQLFCLIHGKAKIYRKGSSSRSQIMRVIQPGQYFGYRAFFAHERYVTSASAFEPSTVALLPMNCVEKICASNPQLSLFFIRQLSIDLGISDRRSISLTQSHIRGRMAETLMFLKEQYGLEEDGATLSIYLSREDLASLSNMTTANAIRTLSIFCTEKLITTDGRKIKLLDERKLLRLSQIG